MQRHAEATHRLFLSKLAPNFRGNYGGRNYVWIPNGQGDKYLKWCCNLNKIPYKEKEEEKSVVSKIKERLESGK